MKHPRGKARIAAIALCAIVAALLCVVNLSAPLASSRPSAAPTIMLVPPPQAIPTPPGAPAESQPDPPTVYAPDFLSATGQPPVTSGFWTEMINQPPFSASSGAYLLTDGRVLVEDCQPDQHRVVDADPGHHRQLPQRNLDPGGIAGPLSQRQEIHRHDLLAALLRVSRAARRALRHHRRRIRLQLQLRQRHRRGLDRPGRHLRSGRKQLDLHRASDRMDRDRRRAIRRSGGRDVHDRQPFQQPGRDPERRHQPSQLQRSFHADRQER